MTTPEEIKTEYTSSLADLTFNSKPLINVLTMLAEENLPNAKIIVEAIEEHLAKVATDVKLPILYLIDCIVKNVGETYTGLFSQNIVSTFCTVFKKVDEKTRLEMFKLRQTWNDVFPQMKLYAIDVQIHQIDPAWPVTAQPTNSIHLNPKFLKNTPTTTKGKIAASATDVAAPTVPALPAKPAAADLDKETRLMQEQLMQKQKELLELQRKTLELEVLQTQVKLQEQMKAGGGVPPITTNILLKPEVAKQLLPDTIVKNRSTDIISSLVQKTQTNQLKINPVNSALAAARPIRDPRLLRQQQEKQKSGISSEQAGGSVTGIPTPNSTVLDTNKHVTNKLGVRNVHKDPRLSSRNEKKNRNAGKSRGDTPVNRDANPMSSQKIEKNSRVDFEKSVNDSRFTSSSSSSLSSSSSTNLDSLSKNKRSLGKHRKRDKLEAKRTHDFDLASSNKREKISPKEDEKRQSDSKQTPSAFKNLKGKSRNYIRRNLTDSPVQLDDEDLRSSTGQADKNDNVSLTENTTMKQKSPEPTTSISTISSMDIDLRKPAIPSNKKRLSSETSEQPPKKRSFDVLFGSEDTDLRQLSIHAEAERKAVVERPPTPPPPIISAKKDPPLVQETVTALSPKKSSFDAVRAKLANATNRDKVMNKSFHKSKIQQCLSNDNDLRPSMMISPEEEKVIRSGHMTSEQEKQFLNKFLSQIEQDKLRQAKKKDHEETVGDMSLQEISDGEFGSDSEDNPKPVAPIPHPPIPFNDKDERLHMRRIPTPITQVQHVDNLPSLIDNGSYISKGENRRPPFRSGRDWRERGRIPLQGPQPRPPIRPWLHQQQPRWGGPFVDESSRSPGEDLEMTIIHEENKTLNIDGIPRDIRIYNETAIIFINYDDPREISFQNGARRVIFNNNETYLLMFGNDYTECTINNFAFRVKLGVPSREIFINEVGFECFFGGPPVHICVNGINMSVQLDGPPPQVKIGEVKRTDLVVGKINLIINATLMIPVFLDGKLQTFMVDGEPCTIKFVDALKRVLINDVPFNVEFGGLPKPCIIHGKKHFIRFSVLPKGIKPGFVRIIDMEGETGASPIRDEENIRPAAFGPLEAEPLRPDASKITQNAGQHSPDNRSNSPGFFNNILQTGLGNFDVISNVLSQSLAPAPSTGGYQVELPGLGPSAALTENRSSTINAPTPNPTFNINELFQKLVDSGFVKTQDNKQSESAASNQSVFSVPPLTVPKEVTSFVGNGKNVQKPSKSQDQISSKPQKRNLSTALKPVSFGRPETLKFRQGALYAKLYSGMQCSSCGMRFSPEASMWYSQHLDWHFRQNRKGKKNARVANSRKWYYSLSDWKNYEELEDLEEREKNYFDQQQQVEVAEEAEEDIEIPSVTADPGTTDERCYVCRDVFEQFFNEEKEEWHLRNAIRVVDKTYHPVCYEDHQKSIQENAKTEEETPNKLIPGLEIILDDDEEDIPGALDEVVSLMDDIEELVPEDAPSPIKDEDAKEDVGDDDGDDDDVILNEVAPIKIVVDDDDDDDQPGGESAFVTQPVVIKLEKIVEFDDGFMDVGEIVSMKDVAHVTIKSEPLDDDIQPHSLNTSVENLVEEPIELNADDEVTAPKPVTSHPELITSMDGNVELMSTAPMPVSTTISGGPKIKINISKPLPVITPKDISKESSDSDVNRCTEVPMEEPEILRYKPALQNVPLRKLPPVKKGNELTGLCSIM